MQPSLSPERPLSSARIALINPNLIVQRHDLFTTGIIYMPISLAYFAGALREAGAEVQVIDAFGESPNTGWREENRLHRGLSPQEVNRRLHPDTSAMILYANQVANHQSVIQLVRHLKKNHPQRPLIIMENTQAVTAYALRPIQEDFYNEGADFILSGEAEQRGIRLLKALMEKAPDDTLQAIDGIGFRRNGQTFSTQATTTIADLDQLPYPAWDLFPLTHYWGLHYAHGPLTSSRYLPLLTSRGCPYPCKFCVIPETNARKWRARQPEKVVDEMQYFFNHFGVREFHIEDVDPTIDDARTRRFCEEIRRRRLPVTWKICAGTKAESIRDAGTLEQMAAAGCRYISISPESGSERVLKLIAKPFDIPHARLLIEKMNSLGIRSQACFVLGYPGEEENDRAQSLALVKDLARRGVDEIAVFIITPIPGSAIYQEFKGFRDYSELTFSPSWRTDYANLSRWRQRLYRTFLINKMLYHPFKLLIQPIRFLSRRFETKMEMVPYRALHTFFLQFRMAQP